MYDAYTVEGFKIISEAVQYNQSIKYIVVRHSMADDLRVKGLLSSAEKKGISVFTVAEREFSKLSSMETPPGLLAVVNKNRESIEENKPCLILDSIKDPGNLGMIIRTSDWFGINNIILGKGTVEVHNPKTLQSSMGSMFHVNTMQNQDLISTIKKLKNAGYNIVATSLDGNEKIPPVTDGKYAIIMGSESFGISRDVLQLADYKYRIPGFGRAESLNVSVAAGIVLYEITRKK